MSIFDERTSCDECGSSLHKMEVINCGNGDEICEACYTCLRTEYEEKIEHYIIQLINVCGPLVAVDIVTNIKSRNV